MTESQLLALQKKGLIKGFTSTKMVKPIAKVKGSNVGCKQVQWMRWNLQYWCNEKALTLEEEYRFHPEKRYRADFAIPSLKVLIEYEGLNSEKSGHTTIGGYTKDTEKYNLAQSMGWRIIRVTVVNYKTVLQELQKFI